MKIQYFGLLLFCLSICFPSFGQHDFSSVDSKAKAVEFTSLETLGEKLTRPFETDLEKVRAIFVWIADNISYDVDLLNNKDSLYKVYSSRAATISYVLKEKKAVCSGYTYLFKELCDQVNIEAKELRGYSRNWSDGFTSKQEISHAWNAVKIDQKWYLLDVTWASGYVNLGRSKFTKKFKDFWFLTRPTFFIYSHFPENGYGTLLKEKLTKEDFFNLPLVHSTNFFKYRIREFRSSTVIADKDNIIRFKFGVGLESFRIDIHATRMVPEASKNARISISSNTEEIAKSRIEKDKFTFNKNRIQILDRDSPDSEVLVKLPSRNIKTISIYIDFLPIVEYQVKFQ